MFNSRVYHSAFPSLVRDNRKVQAVHAVALTNAKVGVVTHDGIVKNATISVATGNVSRLTPVAHTG